MPQSKQLESTTLFQPLRSLSERIRAGTLSPVTLTELSLKRLDTLGRRFNAVVTLMRTSAMEEARAAEKEIKAGKWRGPLHGIPYGAKDLVATKRAPTTWGAAPYKNQKFDFDATVVEKLRNAGAILVAKLSMVELAGGMGYNHADAAFNGPGLCPWNTEYWSGGSSSGPGSAVSAGLVPFAIGSETSGSILTPSAFCGVTGLRPTYGLVSRHGAMALSWTLDKLGPMAHTADDCGLVLEAISGPDPADPSAVGQPYIQKADTYAAPWRPKLAVPKGCIEKVQPAVRDNFNASLEHLGTFCDITRDVEFPDLPIGPAVGSIVGAEGASAFMELIESGRVKELKCPKDRHGGYAAMTIPAVDYLQAMRLRGPLKRELNKIYEKYAAICAPTRATVSYPANQNFENVYPGISGGPPIIPAGNLAGLPALCLPNGYGENNLPTSISFMGPAFSEGELVEIGRRLQALTDWHTKWPPAV